MPNTTWLAIHQLVESRFDALEQLCAAFIRAIGVPKDLSFPILYSKLLLLSKNKRGALSQHTCVVHDGWMQVAGMGPLIMIRVSPMT